MSLKTLCSENIVELIMNMPPLIRDDIIGETTKSIKKEAEEKARKKLIQEIRSSASIVVGDVLDRIVLSHRTGREWIRPEYTKDIHDDLYHTYVEIADNFFYKNSAMLVFDETENRRVNAYINGDIGDDDLSD
jgi:hypothetical protein